MYFYLCFSSRLMLNIVFKANCFIMRNSLLLIKQQGGVILLRWAAQKETTKRLTVVTLDKETRVALTPVDVPVTNPAATILPVHVYPLPQQMRVAFSAARTSNLAPGTLDQPIVFDLLLNNLGETFDLQLGRFNCPVNGTYVFIFHMLKLAVNVPLYVNLMKNEEVLVSAYANDGAPDHETASNHAILQLFQETRYGYVCTGEQFMEVVGNILHFQAIFFTKIESQYRIDDERIWYSN